MNSKSFKIYINVKLSSFNLIISVESFLQPLNDITLAFLVALNTHSGNLSSRVFKL